MKTHVLEREQIIHRRRSEVFAFFADAGNLERITPSFLRFRIATPTPIDVRVGTLIDYRLSLFAIPFSWRTRIDAFEPERRFVDVQLRGPYRVWHHLHEFESIDGGRATRMRDRVDYALPLGPLGEVARALFVARTLDRIFDYRKAAIAEIFEGVREPARDFAAQSSR